MRKGFTHFLLEATAGSKPVVMAFGRMNPGPTIGHEKLINKVKELAGNNEGHHEIILSRSQDPEKNPLTLEQKLRYARTFYPDTNFVGASDDEPTLLHHLSRLYNAGHRDLTMVAGSDRLPEYERLIKTYNGQKVDKKGQPYKHGYFNFDSHRVISSGERDPDSEGAGGASATRMRAAASANDFPAFRAGIGAHVPDEHVRRLFNDTQAGMQPPAPTN